MANGTTVVLSLDDAVLKRGAANSTTIPATTTVTTVENVSLKLTFDEAPANNRLNKVKQQLPTLLGVELEISLAADTADTHLQAFKTAFINRQPIPIQVVDAAAMTGFAFNGIMGVFGWDDPQELPGVPMNKFTLKPWAVGFSGTQPSFT